MVTPKFYSIADLLDELVTSPDRERVYDILDVVRSHVSVPNRAFDAMKKVLCEVFLAANKCPTEESRQCLVRLVSHLKPMSVEIKSFVWPIAMKEACVGCAEVLLGGGEGNLEAFEKQLRFVILCGEERLLEPMKSIMIYAETFFVSEDASLYVPFIYCLLRFVEEQGDAKDLSMLFSQAKVLKAYTCHLNGIVAKALAMQPDNTSLQEMLQFFYKRARADGHEHDNNCVEQPLLSALLKSKHREKFRVNRPMEAFDTILAKLTPKNPESSAALVRHFQNIGSSNRFTEEIGAVLDKISIEKPLPQSYRSILNKLGSHGKIRNPFLNSTNTWIQQTFNAMKTERSMSKAKEHSRKFRLVFELIRLKLGSVKLLSATLKFVSQSNVCPARLYLQYKFFKSTDELAKKKIINVNHITGWHYSLRRFSSAVRSWDMKQTSFEKLPKILSFLESIELKTKSSMKSTPTSSTPSSTPSSSSTSRSAHKVSSDMNISDASSKTPPRLASASTSRVSVHGSESMEISNESGQSKINCHETSFDQLDQCGREEEEEEEDDVAAAAELLKQQLLSAESDQFPYVVSTALEAIVPNINKEVTLEEAVQTLTDFGRISNADGKTFASEMQLYFLHMFNSFSPCRERDLAEPWSTDPDIQSLLEKSEIEAEQQTLVKYINCMKVVERLFTNGMIHVSFVISFIDRAMETRNEVIFFTLLDMFEAMTSGGVDFQLNAIFSRCSPQISLMWDKLKHVQDDPSSSFLLKRIIEEIIYSRNEGFPAVTEQEAVERKLNILLDNVLHCGHSNLHSLSLASNWIRVYLSQFSSHDAYELSNSFIFDIFLKKFENISRTLSNKLPATNISEPSPTLIL